MVGKGATMTEPITALLRVRCRQLLTELPDSGLPEAVETLTAMVAFWRARDAAPPDPPPVPMRGVGRVVAVARVPELVLEDSP